MLESVREAKTGISQGFSSPDPILPVKNSCLIVACGSWSGEGSSCLTCFLWCFDSGIHLAGWEGKTVVWVVVFCCSLLKWSAVCVVQGRAVFCLILFIVHQLLVIYLVLTLLILLLRCCSCLLMPSYTKVMFTFLSGTLWTVCDELMCCILSSVLIEVNLVLKLPRNKYASVFVSNYPDSSVLGISGGCCHPFSLAKAACKSAMNWSSVASGIPYFLDVFQLYLKVRFKVKKMNMWGWAWGFKTSLGFIGSLEQARKP